MLFSKSLLQLPQAIQEFLEEPAVVADAVGQEAEQEDQEGQDEGEGGDDQGLQMAPQGEALGDEKPRQPGEEEQPDDPEGKGKIEKGLQRLVAGIDPHDGRPLPLDEVPQALVKPGGPGGGTGADGNMGHGQAPLAGLDEMFDRVGEVRQYDQPERRLPGVGPKAARGVRNLQPRGPAHNGRAQGR